MKPQPLDPRGRPDPYRAPDRAAWTAKHDAEPYAVAPGERINAKLLENLCAQARRYIERDWSTMSAEESHRHRANLDLLHDEIAGRLGTDDLIFFDPETNQFWRYPES